MKELLFIFACIKLLLLSLSGDVEINPVPRRSFAEAFSICHWNLNSITTRNYIICVTETYLDSETSSDVSLDIWDYELIHCDQQSIVKRKV